MYEERQNKFALWRKLGAQVQTFTDYLQNKVMLSNRVPVPEEELISYIIKSISIQELRT